MIRLSAEQRSASSRLRGPLRVVAGAGTGKTAVIAERCRRLVEAGADPSTILVLTFTERAAAEMRERVEKVLPGLAAAHVGTFHAVALGWLREDGRALGLRPGFRLLTGVDRWIFMRELMWELGDAALVGEERPDDQVTALLRLQERLKQELVTPARLAAAAGRDRLPERGRWLAAAAHLFQLHGERCRRDGLLDFDDLIVLVVRLLESRPALRESIGRRFPWLLVDEYQDTNLAQQRVVELIAGPSGNVCAVGDDDQSIYRFRGASRASLARFLESFPGAASRTLGRNRRSCAEVVEAARSLIERNPDRVPKALRADRRLGSGPAVEVWHCADGVQEAAAIAAGTARLLDSGCPPGRVAVLARTHAVARPVLAALEAAGLPHRHRGGAGLLQRPEVRDVVAWLRAVQDPTDQVALARVVSRPPFGLDLTEAPVSFGPAPAAMLSDLSALAGRLGVDELLFELLDRTRYLDAAAQGFGVPQRARLVANVTRFGELVGEYCERRANRALGPFLEWVDLVWQSGIDEEEAQPEGEAEAVQVMTIHQAKGLEFEAVYLPGLVEGRLPQPHRREVWELPAALAEPLARGPEDHVAEERRLCYVAMTRARRRLVLSWAERYEGPRRWRASRFLAELGPTSAAKRLPPLEGRDVPCRPGLAGPGELSDRDPADAGGPPGRGSGGETAERLPPLILSHSAISAYRECPRQHWFRYRLRLPAPAAVEARFGAVLHLALLAAGQHRQRGDRIDATAVMGLLDEAWPAGGFAGDRREPALRRLAHRLLEDFWMSGGFDRAPRLLEVPFRVDLDGWTLRGVIDRVDEIEPGRWRLIDYKSGRPRPRSHLRRDLQLALYALGARDGLGVDQVRAPALELELVYLRDGKRVTQLAGEDLIEEAKRIGGEVAAGIGEGRFEPRPERRRCAACGYRLACSAAL